MPSPLLVLRVWLIAGFVGAAAADTVVIRDSDSLTGSIEKLQGKRLSLKTKYAGVIEIDWAMVRSITFDRPLAMEMQSGLRLTGTVSSTEDGLLVSSNATRRVVAPSEIKAIAEPVREQRFSRRLAGNAELGYNLSRGNSRLNQSSVNADIGYRADNFKIQADLTSLFAKQGNERSTSAHTASSRLDLFLSPRRFVFALGSLERDDREFLNLRTTAGAGLGLKVLHSDSAELSMLGGLTFVNEYYRGDSSPDISGGEALAGLSLDKLRWGRVSFTAKGVLYPSVIRSGRVRTAISAGVRVPVARHVIWTLRLFEKFDTRPLRPVKRDDYGLISSFGLAF